jgi:hypothetical protein
LNNLYATHSRQTDYLYPHDNDRDSNVIEVLMGRLRKKLDPSGSLQPIETLRKAVTSNSSLFNQTCWVSGFNFRPWQMSSEVAEPAERRNKAFSLARSSSI